MTGRKGRVVSNDDGSITYESRSELDVPVEILNLTEKQRFMDGEKVNAELLWKFYHRSFCLSWTNICLNPTEHCHHLRSCQLGYFLASRPSGEEPEKKSPHDSRAALECRQGHTAVWWVDVVKPIIRRRQLEADGRWSISEPVVYSQGELTGQTKSQLRSMSSWYRSLLESRDLLPLWLKD